MRLWTTIVYIGLTASAAWAQTDSSSIYSATKKDVLNSTTKSDPGGASIMPLVQMVLAVAVVVFLLKSFMPKIAGKINKSLSTKVGSAIKVEESATFAGGTLYIVQAKSKTLLISVNGAGVNCLADITETEPKPSAPTFMEILDHKSEQPVKATSENAVVFLEEVHEDETSQDVASADFAVALERLNRIAK